MTDDEREALIEEAAKAIWIERNAGGEIGWGEAAWAELTMPDDWNQEALDALEEARAALDVFEQRMCLEVEEPLSFDQEDADFWRVRARAALEAALGGEA